jgi:hypothetical protein
VILDNGPYVDRGKLSSVDYYSPINDRISCFLGCAKKRCRYRIVQSAGEVHGVKVDAEEISQ